MKKLLLVFILLFALIGCTKKPTTTTEQQYPYVDEDGVTHVDVSDYVFD